MQEKGCEPLYIKNARISYCFNNQVNSYRDKYLRGEGDSNSYLLTNMLTSYLLQEFF
jgi:hypothetical protein